MAEEKNYCQFCQKEFSSDNLIHAKSLRSHLQSAAMRFFKKFNSDGFICIDDLKALRNYRIQETVKKIDQMDHQIQDRIIQSINQNKIITENIDQEFKETLTFGEKASDAVAKFGGSWLFIGLFTFMILIWITINQRAHIAFDPFPFIFLNLFLSCIAAFQAPIIMMSQNRQNEKDRIRDIEDYQVNLKAELEIQELHNKLDLFIKEEWSKLLEIQKLQLEVAEDIVELTQSIQNNIQNKI
ncbi:MAG: DUF1003 domain-containing protein [Chlamydiae bacterium]|nr:DUF1003 domain-containing protein [Chlamydiota bacterium]